MPGVEGFTEVRYGGRTVKVTLYANTTEDCNKLAGRIASYAMKTNCCPMTVAFGEDIDTTFAHDLWQWVKEKVIERPKA